MAQYSTFMENLAKSHAEQIESKDVYDSESMARLVQGVYQELENKYGKGTDQTRDRFNTYMYTLSHEQDNFTVYMKDDGDNKLGKGDKIYIDPAGITPKYWATEAELVPPKPITFGTNDIYRSNNEQRQDVDVKPLRLP